MAVNFDSLYANIAQQLTNLFRSELDLLGLVDTGALRESIKFVVIKTSSGYTLRMTSLPYYKYLNKRYEITAKTLKRSEFKNIKTQIKKAYNLYIVETLKNAAKHGNNSNG